ncbi:Uncharacterised protein [Mycobacteroides abscessus subsp. abscessus]|nr:Uncharacterised protein [Mycobacteroides abscessus subsp. abscessus]
MSDVVGTLGAGGRDPFPDQLGGGFKAARGLDLGEQRPCLLRKAFR